MRVRSKGKYRTVSYKFYYTFIINIIIIFIIIYKYKYHNINNMIPDDMIVLPYSNQRCSVDLVV